MILTETVILTKLFVIVEIAVWLNVCVTDIAASWAIYSLLYFITIMVMQYDKHNIPRINKFEISIITTTKIIKYMYFLNLVKGWNDQGSSKHITKL